MEHGKTIGSRKRFWKKNQPESKNDPNQDHNNQGRKKMIVALSLLSVISLLLFGFLILVWTCPAVEYLKTHQSKNHLIDREQKTPEKRFAAIFHR